MKKIYRILILTLCLIFTINQNYIVKAAIEVEYLNETLSNYSIIDSTNSGIIYNGTWTESNDSYYYGDSVKVTNTRNSYVEFKVTSDIIKIISSIGERFANVAIYVDDVFIKTASTESPKGYPETRIITATIDGLTFDEHTIKIINLSDGKPFEFDGIQYKNSPSSTNIDYTKLVPTLNNYKLLDSNDNSINPSTNTRTINDQLLYGGSAIELSTKGSSLDINYVGSAIKIIGTTSDNSGSIDIYIDSKYYGRANLHNVNTKHQMIVFEIDNLELGYHNLNIINATEDKVAIIDAIQYKYEEPSGKTLKKFIPNLNGYKFIDNLDKSIVYQSQDSYVDEYEGFYNGGATFIYGKNSYAEFTFKGTEISFISNIGYAPFIASVYLDGVLQAELNSTANIDMFQMIVYEKRGLTNENHTIKILVTQEYGGIFIDGFQYKVEEDEPVEIPPDPEPPKLNENLEGFKIINNNSEDIKYNGQWNNLLKETAYNGDLKYSNKTGDYLEFTFSGTAVNVIGEKGKNCGNISIYIDNGFQETVNAFGNTDYSKVLLYSKAGLTEGNHTLRIYNLDTDKGFYIDCIQYKEYIKPDTPPEKVDPTLQGYLLIDDNSETVLYSGSWETEINEEAIVGNLQKTKILNDFVEFKFIGTEIKWIGQKSKEGSQVEVYIDEVYISTIDTFSNTTFNQVVLFNMVNLSPGEHTIKLINKTEGKYLTVDGFQYKEYKKDNTTPVVVDGSLTNSVWIIIVLMLISNGILFTVLIVNMKNWRK